MKSCALVVGSGLAGLTTAWRLQQRGWRVKLLEASGRPGGRVLSVERDGFILDAGPTLITHNYTEYLKLVDETGLTDSLVDSSPLVGVVKGRDLYLIDSSRPLRSFLSTGLLSPLQKLKVVVKGIQLLKPLKGLSPYDLSSHVGYDTVSMNDYLERVFGPELNESLFAAVARGVTLSTPRDASVLELFAGLKAASGKMCNLIGGMEALTDALASRLDVELNAAVSNVRKDDSGVVVTYRNASGDTVEVRADACVITTRFREAVELYPPLQAAGAVLLKATNYAGLYSLQLLYDRRPDKEPFIIMVPTSASKEVSAVFLEHVKAPDRAPRGKAQITVFFNLASPVDFPNWSDERLTRCAREFVEMLFPELRESFIDSHLTRWVDAAHLGNVGYYKALEEFRRCYPASEPVQLASDYMAVSGQESAVIAGVTAAQRLITQR